MFLKEKLREREKFSGKYTHYVQHDVFFFRTVFFFQFKLGCEIINTTMDKKWNGLKD